MDINLDDKNVFFNDAKNMEFEEKVPQEMYYFKPFKNQDKNSNSNLKDSSPPNFLDAFRSAINKVRYHDNSFTNIKSFNKNKKYNKIN